MYETLFGWIILGQLERRFPVLLTSKPSVDTLIKRFLEIHEPVPSNKLFSTDEIYEIRFIRTITCDKIGKFSVSLLFKLDPSLLGISRGK